MAPPPLTQADAPWKERLHRIIYEAETPAGKAFDVALIGAILLSILVVMLESVESIQARFGVPLRTLEWMVTVLFTVEYVLRLIVVAQPRRYAFSFFGIVDLLSFLPTYASVLLPGSQGLLVLRSLRLLRIFRVFKLGRYLTEASVLIAALRASRPKIIIFMVSVLSIALVMGTVMYLIEGAAHGFTSIPRSVYWAIVTMTTVGYGDIAPRTVLGQTMASALMIMGYAIIAVPTGIVSVELAQAARSGQLVSTEVCPGCTAEGHALDAVYCRRCGEPLRTGGDGGTEPP